MGQEQIELRPQVVNVMHSAGVGGVGPLHPLQVSLTIPVEENLVFVNSGTRPP